MGLFLQMLKECRERFGGGRSGLLGWLRPRRQPTYDSSDQVPEALRAHYEALLGRGQVVWGALAQVNEGMFRPGPEDLPGVTVFSPDPHFDDRPQDLAKIGRAAFLLKNTDPDDSALKPAAARMTDEYDTTFRLPLPLKVTGGRPVLLAGTLFHRSRLPGGVLAARVFPLVIASRATPANMVLPLPYWSGLLQDRWEELDRELSEQPVHSTACRLVEAAGKRPVREEVDWDVGVTPVLVTPKAARAFRAALAAHGVTGKAYLCVEIRTDPGGMERMFADIGPDFDPGMEQTFESNGVRVVVRRDQLDRLRGAVVDHREAGLFGGGFCIRLLESE